MRRLARICLALFGLALATPSVRADPPPPDQGANPSNAHQHRAGLFGSRNLCPECQRAAMMAKGIDVPPVPSLPPGIVMPDGSCSRCQGQMMTSTPATAPSPEMVADSSNPPGHAVVGESAPGYAVVGEMVPMAEPVPIGVVQANYAPTAPPSGLPPMAYYGNRAMMPPQIPPAPLPITSPPSRSPHILGHLFGWSGLGRERYDAWMQRERESHASISYDPQNAGIADLPTSMVYGNR